MVEFRLPGTGRQKPFLTPFLGEGSPTKIHYRKRGALILSSLLEDPASVRQIAWHGHDLGHPNGALDLGWRSPFKNMLFQSPLSGKRIFGCGRA